MKLSKEMIRKFLLGISAAMALFFFVRVSIDFFVHQETLFHSIPKRAFECLLPSAATYFIATYDEKHNK